MLPTTRIQKPFKDNLAQSEGTTSSFAFIMINEQARLLIRLGESSLAPFIAPFIAPFLEG